jgi:hypothetical protein
MTNKRNATLSAPSPAPESGAEPHAPSPPSGLLESLIADAGATARSTPGTAAAHVLSGHLARLDDDGRLWFKPEAEGGEFPVSIGIEVSDGVLVKAVRNRRRALALRTADAPPRWVLVGLMRERVSAAARDARPGRLEVRVDGETMIVDAEERIELRCGKSSLMLRADGRVELSGVYVVHKARGPMKVKGATIALN